MGTKERRQRDVAEREQLFVDAARELIRQDGLLNLQMSRIAEKCEYAVGTLYQHFASKEDLLVALVTQTARQHVDLFGRICAWKSSTRNRMFGIGVADMMFVARNPEHFRIAQYALCEVVWNAASAARRDEMLEVCKPMGGTVVSIVDDAVANGDLVLNGRSSSEIATGLWALTEGFHSLSHAEGVLEQFSITEPYRVMFSQQQHLLNGLGWRPLMDANDDLALDALIKKIGKEVFDEADCSC